MAAGLTHPLETIFLSFIGGVEPFILIAVPLFIFAGEMLSSGGVGKRIVDFARALLGFLPGGLGVVTVAACLMFGGVSGSAIADTAAIGSLVIPAMVQRGYSRALRRGAARGGRHAGAADAAVDPVPRLRVHLRRVDAPAVHGRHRPGAPGRGRPDGRLHVARQAHRLRQRRRSACPARQVWVATKDAGPALLMPVIIVGGIWSGVFTPTESAAVAVVYGVTVSLTLYKDITVRDLPRLLVNAFQTSATVMLVIGATGALAWLITVEQVATQMAGVDQARRHRTVDVPDAGQRRAAAARHLHRAAAGDAAHRAAAAADCAGVPASTSCTSA